MTFLLNIKLNGKVNKRRKKKLSITSKGTDDFVSLTHSARYINFAPPPLKKLLSSPAVFSICKNTNKKFKRCLKSTSYIMHT